MRGSSTSIFTLDALSCTSRLIAYVVSACSVILLNTTTYNLSKLFYDSHCITSSRSARDYLHRSISCTCLCYILRHLFSFLLTSGAKIIQDSSPNWRRSWRGLEHMTWQYAELVPCSCHFLSKRRDVGWSGVDQTYLFRIIRIPSKCSSILLGIEYGVWSPNSDRTTIRGRHMCYELALSYRLQPSTELIFSLDTAWLWRISTFIHRLPH